MSTRGLFGLRKDRKEKAVYNHFDSYPEGLGKNYLTFVKLNQEQLPIFYDKVKCIDKSKEATPEEIAYCKEMGWDNPYISSRPEKDWDSLLYYSSKLTEWQKCLDLGKNLFIENQIDFIKDSLFCEYAYIYDIDTRHFQVYFGFQKEPDIISRYGTEPLHGYFPCKLVASIPVNQELNITKSIQSLSCMKK